MGNLTSLEELNLGFNGLTGEIPPELGELGRMASLRLSHNNLTGAIPPELGNLFQIEGRIGLWDFGSFAQCAYGVDSTGVGERDLLAMG